MKATNFVAVALAAIALLAAPAHAAQTEAPWTGAADFPVPNETTPGYEGMLLGGWGGDAADHTPRRDGVPLDHVFVFVHGNSGDASLWDAYRTDFQNSGFNDSALWAISYVGGSEQDTPMNQFTEGNSTDLMVFLEAVAVYTGVSKARVVAHSQGGLITKDMIYEHWPIGITVTRFTTIASPHGDKTSADDAGVAVCLNPLFEQNPWCTDEFGATPAAQNWRDARVIDDPELTAIQVIYSGTESDETYYYEPIIYPIEDVRFSPRDNVASGTWPGTIEYAQHGTQDHRELRDLNQAEVLAFITDPCSGSCGNDTIECDEVCDGIDLGGEDCQTQGFDSGDLVCDGFCAGYDTSGCEYSGGEVCGDLWCAGEAAGEDCSTCAADCPGELDVKPKNRFCCGDGDCKDGKEDIVSCPIDCGGSLPECGNNTIETGEECDGTDLGNETCQSMGYDCGGTLACDGSCAYDITGCSASTCGDGTAECSEICDGADLGGETCQSQGFDSGDLACNGSCDGYDTSGCVGGGEVCGNGYCAGEGEDCNSCPADCPGKTGGKPSKLYCCGNGTCEPVGEDNASCPVDCP